MTRASGSLTEVATRWSRDPNLRADALFATLVGVVAIAEALTPDEQTGAAGADTFAYITLGVAAASLLLRRHLPLTVFAIVTTVLGVFYLRDGGEFLSLLGLSAFYAVAAHSDQRRRAWIALLLGGTILFAIACFTLLDTPDGYNVDSAGSMLAFLIGTTAIGLFVRNRQRIFADSEQRAATAEADRLASAERARADERSRIAREMHDVVAHGMSVISVQAAAAQEIVHTDPDKAAEVLGRIENVGRQSLNEMRRMLGVLRSTPDDGAPSLEPQPSLGDVNAAVTRSTEAGVQTDLVVTGTVRELPPGIELTGFRIVQESLTNVLKHAGPSASAVVTIAYGDDDVVISVVDDGQGAVSSLSKTGGGNGVIGMRERVEIYGGDISVGPVRGGGFSVRVVLPASDIERGLTLSSAAGSPADPEG